MIRIAFIINGSKKLTRSTEEVIVDCESQSQFEVSRLVTKKQRDASELAFKCSEEYIDFIIGVGGDGTINEILNGIMRFNGKIPVLGVLPNGTGNDFVRSAKLKLNRNDFVRSIIDERIINLDTVKISAGEREHYFLNIADVGFGAKVVELMDRQRKYISGKSSYALAILRTFLRYKRPIVSIQADDFHYEGEILMVAICNGSTFGSGLTINPFAKMDDGILNITLLKKVKLLDYVKNLKNLKSGIPIKHDEAVYFEAKNIEIKILKGNAFTEMDGEFLNEGNIIADKLTDRIKILSY